MSDIETIVSNLLQNEVLTCQSALVDQLMKTETDGFQIDDIENLYVDPSEFTLEECHEKLTDEGYDCPDPDPWEMDKQQLTEFYLEETDEPLHDTLGENFSLEEARAAVVEAIDNEEFGDLEEWRDEVRDNIPPNEPYEWWLVTDYLASYLRDDGQPIIENGFGTWWGRCTTGQAIKLDGVMQRIARSIQAFASA